MRLGVLPQGFFLNVLVSYLFICQGRSMNSIPPLPMTSAQGLCCFSVFSPIVPVRYNFLSLSADMISAQRQQFPKLHTTYVNFRSSYKFWLVLDKRILTAKRTSDMQCCRWCSNLLSSLSRSASVVPHLILPLNRACTHISLW